jgi:F0F1-type ATP synthase membrane subunit b/b'
MTKPMIKASRWFAGSALGAGLMAATTVWAADEHGAGHDDHAAGHAEAGEHGGHGGSHEINWIYGVLGEGAEGEEPTLLFRSPGMPVPLLAYLINSAILFTILFKFGKQPLMDGLAKRREEIMRGMEEAAAMRKEAMAQLAVHEAKLEKVDAEVARIRTEMRQAAEAERTHILAEAKKRRERMERDAKQMIAQELKSAKEQLLEETVRIALQRAEILLTQAASDADHERLCEEYLGSLTQQLPGMPGGRA